MRFFSVLLWLVLAAPAVGTEFPYTVYVTADGAEVRSGPGENYYATDRLEAGQKVEVYRHDPDGWYAIRPPSGSFTWVSASRVRRIEDGLGRVTGERIAARTGSRLSDARGVIQLRLEQDEIVEIIGEVNDVGQSWYKIAPPSGEFRWISFQYVGRQPARNVVDEPEGAIQTTSYREPADEPGLEWKARGQKTSRVARRERTKADRAVSAVDKSAEMLDSIEEQLSLMIAEEPAYWRFEQIRREIQTTTGQAESVVVRSRARRMLDRIDRFEQIRRRYQNVDAPRAGTDWQNYQVAEEDPLWSVAPIERFADRRASPATSPATSPSTPSVASSLASSLRRATGHEPQQSAPSRLSSPLAEATAYDGEGILRPVISRRRGAPGFALVDEQGAVLSFVTPARGVVLETHLGRKVGITGARGYMPEYRRPHLVAQQVAVLDDLTEQSVVNSGAARSTSAAATTSTSRSAAGETPLRHRRY